eukprot:CAMPEP_0117660368 /NCGR_PEP_ID=MMETSP0804-20121206/6931_1 /TAXON_ID=1074897 /ORGANISM="Tetraselmis astigmatica, Strain CCMP880" /LENGTH=508 /DNA_ID=CAMNT_0005467093 /DNA_START=292 /DNA_END=1818 /DNA_ORIENTATION=+
MAPYPRSSIICTVGPNTPIEECVEAGMRIMRLNCSHGDREFYESKINRLRTFLANRPNKDSLDPTTGVAVNCAVALDLKGPEIRTGQLSALGGQLDVATGDSVILSTDPAIAATGTASGIPEVFVDYPNITKVVGVGSMVYIDDGLLRLEVTAKTEGRLECVSHNNGAIGERKGVNLPGAILDLPAVSEKDIEDIKLAAEVGADFIFASFVRKAEHVHAVKGFLEMAGNPGVKVISKIENQEGCDNFLEILEASDGIMVARGDLGIEIPAHKVVTAQKKIIAACNAAGKPVVCATQMLESMIVNPRPTRAEVSDVANAVLDGADCLMLSGETAKGQYPIEAITTMGQTCREADNLINYHELFNLTAAPMFTQRTSSRESICAAAVRCAVDQRASLIIVFTTSGNAVRFVSKYRPPMPVLAVTQHPMVARQCFMNRGITPLLMEDMAYSDLLCTSTAECSIDDIPLMVTKGGVEYAKRVGICSKGDTVVAVMASAADPKDLTMRTFPVQ